MVEEQNSNMPMNDHESNSARSKTEETTPEDQLDNIASYRYFGPEEVLFQEGQRGGEAFIIRSGQVRMSHEKDGVAVEFDRSGPNSLIGEMAIISDMPRMATATADDETICIALSRSSMKRILAVTDVEVRTTIEFLIDYIRDIDDGEGDDDAMQRKHHILKYILGDPDTEEKLKNLEPVLNSSLSLPYSAG
jgi:CRP/FNR family cyclic AMP-dependent transcriptional regulator